MHNICTTSLTILSGDGRTIFFFLCKSPPVLKTDHLLHLTTKAHKVDIYQSVYISPSLTLQGVLLHMIDLIKECFQTNSFDSFKTKTNISAVTARLKKSRRDEQ